jgi:hypothetical protein
MDPSGTGKGCAVRASGNSQSSVMVASSSPSPAADLALSDITSTAPATAVQPIEM